jgi:hypothetical protein
MQLEGKHGWSLVRARRLDEAPKIQYKTSQLKLLPRPIHATLTVSS